MAPDAGANDALADADLADELLASAEHLHVAGYALLRPGSRPAARAAISRALERGMTVSVDPSSAALLSPEFLDHAEGAGLLLPNADEAQMLTGESDPERAARALAARFGEVVVTLGAEGALWTDGRESVRAEAVPVEAAVDSTGAGDAFAAGLLAARLDGAAPAEALAAARSWRRRRWRGRAAGRSAGARRRSAGAPPAFTAAVQEWFDDRPA